MRRCFIPSGRFGVNPERRALRRAQLVRAPIHEPFFARSPAGPSSLGLHDEKFIPRVRQPTEPEHFYRSRTDRLP